MSVPVVPTSGTASQPRLVSFPQIPKIVQDVVDCIHQLKNDFAEQMSPITDDSQILQRFCAKLEYLLQYEMKDRFTLLGKRKEYWDYFCECLGSNKGSNDGIRYVKSLGEHKTSLGKGRAFLRFALVHQRLADSLQQCIINQKTTSEWYNPGSIWLQPKTSSSVVGTLYDLNDIHFDLSPRGYDLDSAWPSFARKSSGNNTWNVPLSRRSSITSMDTVSLSASIADPSEIDRLQQQLASAETARAVLTETVGSLEQERQRAEQSVWMSQGELSAIQEQLKAALANYHDLQKQYTVLETSHEKLKNEKLEEEEQYKKKADSLVMLQSKIDLEKERLLGQTEEMRGQLEEEKVRFQAEIQVLEHRLSETEESRDKLSKTAQSLEENLDRIRGWEAKKDQLISKLEEQIASLEQRNSELTEELAKSLSAREKDAEIQLESTKMYQDVLEKLKGAESQNIQLQVVTVDMQHKLTAANSAYEDQVVKANQLSAQLAEEAQKRESKSAELRLRKEELEKAQRIGRDSQERLESELANAQQEVYQAKLDIEAKEKSMSAAVNRHYMVAGILSQLLAFLGEVIRFSGKIPNLIESDDKELRTFSEVFQESATESMSVLVKKLEDLEKMKERFRKEADSWQMSVSNVLKCFPELSGSSSTEVTQQIQEVERRVQTVLVQLSDLAKERDFLKEQLQLSQGEHSDKGKQLSHLEGRLLELEKMLKESRVSETSLQSQVLNMEGALKNDQSRFQDLEACVDSLVKECQEKREMCEKLNVSKGDLESQLRDKEKQTEEMTLTVAKMKQELQILAIESQNFKERTEELEKIIEGKNSQRGSLRQKAEESENSLNVLQLAFSDLQEKNAATVQGSERLKQQVATLLDDQERLCQEMESQKQDKAYLQQQLDIKVAECDGQSSALDEKSSELISFKKLHEELVNRHKHECCDLTGQLQQSQAELAEVKEELNQLTSRLTDITTLTRSLELRREELERQLESVRTALQEKEIMASEEIKNLTLQLDVFRLQKEDLQRSASSSEEEKTKTISEKDLLIAQLKKQKCDLEQRWQELERKCEDMEKETAKYQQQIADMEKAKRLGDEKQKQEVSHLNEGIRSLKEENLRLLEELEEVKCEISTKMEEARKAKAEAESTKEESERLRSDSATEKSELEDSLERLQLRFSELQTSMDIILKEKEELMSLRDVMQEEIIELKQDLAASGDSYRFLLQSSQKVYEEKDNEITFLKSELQQAEKILKELSSELEVATQEKNALEVKVWTLEKSEQDLKEEVTDKQRLADVRSKQAEELKQLVQSLTNSVTVLEEDARSKREELEQVEQASEEKENAYTTQIESLQQELSALQFQLSAEQMQHEESLRSMGSHESSLADMSTRLTDQEAVISHLEKELSLLQMSFESERSNQESQLGDLKKLLKKKEMECKQLADSVQRTSDKLEETLLAAESLQVQNSSLRKSIDRDIEEREEEIRTLRSDNEQLKKQLVKVIREKAALWQQSDTLAYEHKRKAGEKWLDNNAVTHCMGCNSEFSLFLRKHHCRSCGRIFCWSCADKWVDSPSSSRKARACRRCFEDLRNLDVSIAKASLLPEFSDDESSNVESDVASPLDSTADDRSYASLNQTVNTESSLNAEDENSLSQSTEDIYRSTSRSNEGTREGSPDSTFAAPVSALAAADSDGSLSERVSQDGVFQVITQEEVTKSIRAYDGPSLPQKIIDVPNMSSSLLVSAEDLMKGEISNHSEFWVKPGHSFVVPIGIDMSYTVIGWEFTVTPKDIQFSITYQHDENQPISKAEELLAPVRCHSLKEPVTGQLTAKKPGVYNLVFDNSYSRMTSKRIHYQLKYSNSS